MENKDANRDRSQSAMDGTSSSLLCRAKESDPVAWNRIVECYSPLVFDWCVRAGMNADEARDVGQDVFLAAYCKLPKFTPRYKVGSFRGWLRAITRSKFIDYVTRDSKSFNANVDTEKLPRDWNARFPSDDELSVRRDLLILHRQVERFIREEFSNSHCEAFFRVTVQEQLPADVAEQLGMTRNAVYLACTRIRRRVKDEFSSILEPTAFC